MNYGEDGYCENGGFAPDYIDWSGADYNYPEDNCCACGKIMGGR